MQTEKHYRIIGEDGVVYHSENTPIDLHEALTKLHNLSKLVEKMELELNINSQEFKRVVFYNNKKVLPFLNRKIVEE